MVRPIRSLLGQDDSLLSGTVEADEAFFGGQGKWKHESKKQATRRHPTDPGPRGGADKTAVFGMAQRGQNGSKGKVVDRMVSSASRAELPPHLTSRVLP